MKRIIIRLTSLLGKELEHEICSQQEFFIKVVKKITENRLESDAERTREKPGRT